MNELRQGAKVRELYDSSFQNKYPKGHGSYYPIYQYPIKWDWRDVRGWDWTTPIRGQIGHVCRYFACYDILESCLRIWSKIYRDTKGVRIDELLADQRLQSFGTTDADGYGGLKEIADEICSNGIPITGIEDELLIDHLQRYGLLKKSYLFSKEGNFVLIPSKNQIIKDENIVKEWIHRYGPVVTSIRQSGNISYYEEGIVQSSIGDEASHAVSIYGYDEEKQYWICRNTFGTNWGEDGWFRVLYGSEINKNNGFAEKGFLIFSPPEKSWTPNMILTSVAKAQKKK